MRTMTLIKALSVLLIATLCTVSVAQQPSYSKVTLVYSDADGTPFAATDRSGNQQWKIEHRPYGEEHSNTQVARNNALSFAGKPYDEEIGLSYFGARWYDPALGRFTGVDAAPVNPNDYRTFNRYAYANNNPYKYVDPDGNIAFAIPLAIFIAKELAAAAASEATNGYSDYLSIRKLGTKGLKRGATFLKNQRATQLCFVKGTLVHTDQGLKPIETLMVGDMVLSKDEERGQSSYKTISQLYVNEDKPVLDIEIELANAKTESFGITKEHPVWVQEQGWTEAGNLKLGDQINTQSGKQAKVKSIAPRGGTETTYNIEVEDFHTYFVGNSGLWVHNMCDGKGAIKGPKPLLGQNPKIKKDRTNTDLGDVNDPAVAKSIFRNQTKGQKVQQFENNGNIRRRAEDGTQIRLNSNGSVRVDLPGRGSQPNGETIHLSGKKGG